MDEKEYKHVCGKARKLVQDLIETSNRIPDAMESFRSMLSGTHHDKSLRDYLSEFVQRKLNIMLDELNKED